MTSEHPQAQSAKPLFSYRKYWAQRFGVAPFLPMSRQEMDALGWDSCDVILVTGDAYIDHRSEERRVGKECCALCRSRWSPYH